jgi:hypothetical protein
MITLERPFLGIVCHQGTNESPGSAEALFMKIIYTQRQDEVVIKGTEVKVGMVISTDDLCRTPINFYLVTEITPKGVIRGAYIGTETDRNREVQTIVGTSFAVTHYPQATICLHGRS